MMWTTSLASPYFVLVWLSRLRYFARVDRFPPFPFFLRRVLFLIWRSAERQKEKKNEAWIELAATNDKPSPLCRSEFVIIDARRSANHQVPPFCFPRHFRRFDCDALKSCFRTAARAPVHPIQSRGFGIFVLFSFFFRRRFTRQKCSPSSLFTCSHLLPFPQPPKPTLTHRRTWRLKHHLPWRPQDAK